MMSGNEAWNRNFRRWRKVDRDGADITSGRLFQVAGPATEKARPPTVDSLTDGTSRRLVRADRSERGPGRSAWSMRGASYSDLISTRQIGDTNRLTQV